MLPSLPTQLDKKTRIEEFAEKHIKLFEGQWAGKPVELMDWQRWVFRRIFNDRDLQGRRRVNTFYCSVPRKNAKSSTAAILALYMLCADPEPGAQIYSAAKDRDQAKLVLNMAKRMVEQDPHLFARAKLYKNEIIWNSRQGERIYRALSYEATTAHGLNPNCLILDELHAWEGERGREFYDVLTTAQGARREPLTFIITTAGYDKESICYEIDSHAQKVAAGEIEDPSFASLICRPSDNDDWTDAETWRKANPSFGITVPADHLEKQYQRALNTPAFQNAFLRLHLNLWTEAETRFIGSEQWAACGFPVDAEDLKGRSCTAGLDLSSTTDLTALVLVFPPQEEDEPYQVLPFF